MRSEKHNSLILQSPRDLPGGTHLLHTDVTIRAPSTGSWKRVLFAVCSLTLISLRLVYKTPFLPRLAIVRSPLTTSRNPSYLIVAHHGAVATENKRCSDIGVNILKDGGNAIDAAIGAALCIGVVNMFSAGIGGGGSMVVRIPPKQSDGSSEVFTINFRGIAPMAANKTMYANDPTAAKNGGLAVGVPAELRGWEAAHSRWGRLPWYWLVKPSVELAAGWTVDVMLAEMIQTYSELILNNPDWTPIFAPDGKLLLQGQLIRRTNYSRTLDMIANQGPGAFYKGPIADSIIRKVGKSGGILTHADFEDHNVKIERALEGSYHGKKVYTTHAPTSGPILLHMLNLLEEYDLVSEGGTPLNVHRIVEVEKFGFAAQTRIGDLNFYPGNKSRVFEIPTKQFANSIAGKLTDDRTHPAEYYNPDFDVQLDHGTSHISVADKDGMAVAITHTLKWYFGSQVLDPETGVILNDEMYGFTLPGLDSGLDIASPYNYIEPGKRPLSSVAPAVVEYPDGTLNIVVGASGGSRIIPAVTQTLLNLDWGMDVSQAVEYGRVLDTLYPEVVYADDILPAVVIDGLLDRGHNVTLQDPACTECFPASVQAIVRKDGKLYATSDSRKHGIAAGY